MEFVPKKLYYKIREVCEIVGVEAHVLRFWETEFPALSPPKSKSGQRTYRPKDIELLLRIQKLLYEEGYTIVGARKQLSGRNSIHPDAQSSKMAPMEESALLESEDDIIVTQQLGSENAQPCMVDGAVSNNCVEPKDQDLERVPDVAEVKETPAIPAEKTKEAKPPSERLKRVQAELENILTLLDRE
jgi:DNA-binding transcriptional MerR regulator